MYVLGIETATLVAGVAVIREDRLLAERMVNNKKNHSSHLMPMIKEVIEESGVSPAELDGVAVSAGPGSFTGLRIGMSTAKTLAQAWQIPVAGVGTLDALAHPLTGMKNLVCPVLNARKNEVYTAVYDGSGGSLERLAGPLAIRPEDLVHILLEMTAGKVTFLGDGVTEYMDMLVDLMSERAVFAPPAVRLPRGSSVAGLGLLQLKEGRGLDPLALLPNYVRNSEAVLKWQQKQQKDIGG